MLRLIIGKAGAGKTAAIINEIKNRMGSGGGRAVVIVPEQYSHEAERELCRVCGDSLSLYAEVMSFSALARQTAARLGGLAKAWLDKGGRLLCMTLALQSVAPRLRVYAQAQRRADLQSMLLSAIDELKTACIDHEALAQAADACQDSLGDKLHDLALIAEAFDSVVANGHADPLDKLSVLAKQIRETGLGDELRVYVDGFIDFTCQEQEVLTALLKRGTELTVCLTADSLESSSEIFELSSRAGRMLISVAKELGCEISVECMDEQSSKNEALCYYADNMFSYGGDSFTKPTNAIRLYRCESISAECEQAAALCLELVRDRGYRWRDIAISVRGFEDYRASLETVFEQYGIPIFSTRRSELMSKPLPSLIALSYDIIHGGWAADDVISYMRTGLTALDTDECDELEGYIFKWRLQANAWLKHTAWRQHPDGYGKDLDDSATERLEKINELRYMLAAPLLKLAAEAEQAQTATEHVKALASYLECMNMPERLSRRAEQLEQDGEKIKAAEYRQLWELIVSALEQCDAILGSLTMDSEEFSRLLLLMLSKYDIATIPVSLDRVSAGDFDRNRRRSVKHLIVLGVTDNRLPKAEESVGVFSSDERKRLLELEIDLSSGGESELWREFSLIYTCLTMPSEGLTLMHSVIDSDGAELRPALVFNRARELFSLEVTNSRLEEIRSSALKPALLLAAKAIHYPSDISCAAAEYFSAHQPQRYASLKKAANMSRGRLSKQAVEKLYGSRLRLSASRIDKFSSCHFAYFCQYGLAAKPYVPADFKPPEFGSLAHYVLENVASEVKKLGGFTVVDNARIASLTDKFVDIYIAEQLNDFREKTPRFIYLFKRLCGDVRRIVIDTAEELRRSDFEPLSFELDFSAARDIPPVDIGDGEDSFILTGIADRVDGWYHDGKLYLRVVDYKTGRKEFSLSDVWYGMNLQMLLYLFALEGSGKALYGEEPHAAGIMYVPAKSKLLSLKRDMEQTEIDKERASELRRSGLVLDNDALLEAWERGADKRYIPVKFKNGKPDATALASTERLGLLKRHIKKGLTEMARQLKSGSIAADPWYRGQQENACLNCDYLSVCHFTDGDNGESCRFTPKLKPEEIWSILEEGIKNG